MKTAIITIIFIYIINSITPYIQSKIGGTALAQHTQSLSTMTQTAK